MLALCGYATSAMAADVAVNVGSKKQVIDGFGASSAWSGAMSDKIFNGLYTDLGYSILRLRIEDSIGDNWKSGNFSAWASELSNAKKAIARGAIVFASPWSPPKSMQQTFTHATDKTNPFRLNPSMYADYLDYLNAYAKHFKDNGAELYAISLQNEPDYADGWCWWTAEEILTFLKTHGAKINSRVIAPESFQFRKVMSDPILNDPAALEVVDIIGYHIYGTPVSGFSYPLFQQKAAPLGKKLWQTEHYVNEDDNIGTIMAIGKEIHDIMVTGNANAYVYWWIPHANGLTSNAGDLFKRAYVIGQFAKHIRPGYFRVDATATPATNVYVSAYAGDGKLTIVAVNSGTSAVSQRFTLEGATVAQFATWQTSSSANMAAGAPASVSGNAFSFSLPAQSITTFVGTNTSAVPSGTGGALATGGVIATGGTTASGGVVASGGSMRVDAGSRPADSGSTGGQPSTGGNAQPRDAAAAGGIVATGGISSTGGITVATGGTSSGGQTMTGGLTSTTGGLPAATGGVLASGGTAATGGSIQPGTVGDGCSCRVGSRAGQRGVFGLVLVIPALAWLRHRRRR